MTEPEQRKANAPRYATRDLLNRFAETETLEAAQNVVEGALREQHETTIAFIRSVARYAGTAARTEVVNQLAALLEMLGPRVAGAAEMLEPRETKCNPPTNPNEP